MQTGQAQKVFQQTYNYVRETALLESTLALLEWDERTGLPSLAGDHRAQQVTFLSGLVHQRKTSPQFGDWLNQLAHSELALHSNHPVGASIRGMRRDFDKNIQLPEALVKRIAHAVTIGQQVWSDAKPKNDFAAFLPHLEAIAAPGHTPGHLLFYLTGGEVPLLFTGDAAKNRAELLCGKVDLSEDHAQSEASLKVIWDCWKKVPGTLLIPGHDLTMRLDANGAPEHLGERRAAIAAWFGEDIAVMTQIDLCASCA